VAKTAITLKGSRQGFAGAAPGATSLDGYFDPQRQVEGPQIRRSSPYTKRLFVHQFRVVHLDQLDDNFATWIAEAYQVGQGAHLSTVGVRFPAVSDLLLRPPSREDLRQHRCRGGLVGFGQRSHLDRHFNHDRPGPRTLPTTFAMPRPTPSAPIRHAASARSCQGSTATRQRQRRCTPW
jgi:hypothetical protein